MQERCNNPELCKKRHDRWKNNQAKFVPIGAQEHELFLEYTKRGEADLGIKIYPDQERSHAEKRQIERAISLNDIRDVLKHGWVIERNINFITQAVRLVILGYTKRYRPIHVVVEILTDKEWEVVTVYSPESKAYKWNESYEEKICFCTNL